MSKPTYGEMRTRTQQLFDEDTKERVLAGLTVLQEEFGERWVEKIDCASLDLASSARCVLGQVYGDYDDGVIALVPEENDNDEWAHAHGFYDCNSAYDELQVAWETVLCDGVA